LGGGVASGCMQRCPGIRDGVEIAKGQNDIVIVAVTTAIDVMAS
jgi:hypothetical protein